MVMVAVATFICELISYILQMVIFKLSIDIFAFVRIIAVEILFNSMVIIIIYPIIEKAGTLLERIFTQDKILTRYY